MKKSTIGMLVIIIIVLAIVYVFATRSKPQNNDGDATQNNQQKISQKETIVKQDTTTVLSAFPDGFPTENGVGGSSGYKYVPANSLEQQSTLEYTSQKTLAENAKIFKDYLTTAGFKISNTVSEKDFAFYYATKDNNDLSIKIKQTGAIVTVSATYLKR